MPGIFTTLTISDTRDRPRRRRLAVALFALLLLLPWPAGAQPATQPADDADAHTDGKTVKPVDVSLQLKTIAFDGGMLHLDTSLVEHQQHIVERTEAFIATARAAEKSMERFKAMQGDVIQAVNELLGIEAEDVSIDQQRIYDNFISGSRVRLSADDGFQLYVVRKDNAKAYLKAGGKLPYSSYDPQTDTGQLSFQFAARGAVAPTMDQMTLPIDEDAVQASIVEWFERMNQLADLPAMVVAVHEVVEFTLVSSVQFDTPYRRWFSDGVAEVVTARVLRRVGENELAQKYNRPIEQFAELRDRINLQYWLNAEFEINTPLKAEKQLKLARYAFATHEVGKLVDEHGMQVIGDITRELRKHQRPTADDIFAAIKTVTDVDMRERLARYNEYEDRQAADKAYQSEYNEAADTQDHEKMLSATLRLLEVNLAESPDPRYYELAAELLKRLDHPEAAVNAVKQLVKMSSKQEDKARFRKKVLVYALHVDRPELAYGEAATVLEHEGNNLVAGIVHLYQLREGGDVAQAREKANQALRDLQDRQIPELLARHLRILTGREDDQTQLDEIDPPATQPAAKQ